MNTAPAEIANNVLDRSVIRTEGSPPAVLKKTR